MTTKKKLKFLNDSLEFILKYRSNVMTKNVLRTKTYQHFLKGLKTKFQIFIKINNLFTLYFNIV